MLTLYVFPRSKVIHALSAKFDDQRVPVFPSTAYFAAIASLSLPDDEAVIPLVIAFASVSSGVSGTSGVSVPPVIV